MQSFDNTRKKYIKIKNEPEIESLEMHNSFQGSSSLQLELDSKEVDPDFVAVELKNEMKELEEGNSSQLQMLSNNIFGIKTEPTTLSLEQEINAFSAEFNIKSENEGDYSQINSRGSKTQSSSSRSHSLYSEYSESVDSIIACLDSGSSQQGLNLVSDLEEASDSEKRRKTLTVQLKNGELVVLTNSRKASWTGRQKNKSEFQLYENQVELWESLTRRTQDQLKEHNSEEFQRAIKKKCRDRETLGIKLNNGERVTLDHNKTIGWNQFTEEEKNELRKLGEEDFFKEINKKAQEAKSLKITLTPEGSENIEVSLNAHQVAAGIN